MWTSYGPLGIGAYLGVYVTTLGSIFLALDYDLFHAAQVGLDPASAIEKVSISICDNIRGTDYLSLKVCNLIEGVTGSTAFPGYIKEHPRGIYF